MLTKPFDNKVVLNACEQHWSASAAKLYRLAKTSVESTADGIYVYDHQGKQFIDCACSYGVFIVGHQNPIVKQYAVKQLKTLAWANNDKQSALQQKLTNRLQEITPGEWGAIRYTLSGAEAIEQSLRYVLKVQSHKQNIIVCKNSYHGKTLAAMNILGQHQHHNDYGRLSEQVKFIDYGDVDGLRAALGSNGAKAFYLEPILGGAHLSMPPKGYLKQVAALCQQTGTLLVADEIQTAFGRCGEMYAVNYEQVIPDIMVLSKGLTGGYASFACAMYSKALCTRAPVAQVELDTASNGGHPFACAAALGALDYIEQFALVDNAKQQGAVFAEGLAGLAKKYPNIIADAPAIGLMTGLRLRAAIYESLLSMQLNQRGIHAGHSMNEKATSPVLRFYPPLQIDQKTIVHILQQIDDALAAISNMPKPVITILKPVIKHMYKFPNVLLRRLS